jgi:hypothetical protein
MSSCLNNIFIIVGLNSKLYFIPYDLPLQKQIMELKFPKLLSPKNGSNLYSERNYFHALSHLLKKLGYFQVWIVKRPNNS